MWLAVAHRFNSSLITSLPWTYRWSVHNPERQYFIVWQYKEANTIPDMITIYNHGGESRDLKTADTIEKNVDSGNTFFDSSVNTGQICKGFEADTPENWEQQVRREFEQRSG